MPLIHPFTHTLTHQWRLAAMQGTNQLIRSNRGLGVLLRRHFDTPRVGLNRQPSDCQTTALTSWAILPPKGRVIHYTALLTSVPAVYSLDSSVQHREASLLNLPNYCRRGPELSGVSLMTGVLRPQYRRTSLWDRNCSVYKQRRVNINKGS